MAHIRCTRNEYHRFLGPFVRNRVNAITRKMKKGKNGICESCNEERILESAHIHGKGRKKIIEKVLSKYTNDEGIIEGNLFEIESKIIEEHIPIEKTIKFLCNDCHREYDRNNPYASKTKRAIVSKRLKLEEDSDFRKINRIRLWAQREHQANHKFIQAYLKLSLQGNVTWDILRSKCLKEYGLNESKIEGHFASLKTDKGNSHGKVFYEENGYVYVFPVVMEEIKKHFII